MLPDATQREVERCLARLLVDTASSLVVLMSPIGHVFAWQGIGVYDSLILAGGSTQMPLLDANVRRRMLEESGPDSARPREYGRWVAPDIFLWLIYTATPSQLQQRMLKAVTEIQSILRRAGLL
jgi:hypothetical protein